MDKYSVVSTLFCSMLISHCIQIESPIIDSPTIIMALFTIFCFESGPVVETETEADFPATQPHVLSESRAIAASIDDFVPWMFVRAPKT